MYFFQHSGWYLITVTKVSVHPKIKTNNRVLRSPDSDVIVCNLNRVQERSVQGILYLSTLLSIQCMLQLWSFWTCIGSYFRTFIPQERNEVYFFFSAITQWRFVFKIKNIVGLILIYKMKRWKTTVFVTLFSLFHTPNAKFFWMNSSINWSTSWSRWISICRRCQLIWFYIFLFLSTFY